MVEMSNDNSIKAENAESKNKRYQTNYYQARKGPLQEKAKEQARRYYKDNTASVIARVSEYDASHKEQAKERLRNFRKRNPEKVREDARKYREENKDRINENARKSRERRKQWDEFLDDLAKSIPDEPPHEPNHEQTRESQLNIENMPKKRKAEVELEPVSNAADSESVSKASAKTPAKKREILERKRTKYASQISI